MDAIEGTRHSNPLSKSTATPVENLGLAVWWWGFEVSDGVAGLGL